MNAAIRTWFLMGHCDGDSLRLAPGQVDAKDQAAAVELFKNADGHWDRRRMCWRFPQQQAAKVIDRLIEESDNLGRDASRNDEERKMKLHWVKDEDAAEGFMADSQLATDDGGLSWRVHREGRRWFISGSSPELVGQEEIEMRTPFGDADLAKAECQKREEEGTGDQGPGTEEAAVANGSEIRPLVWEAADAKAPGRVVATAIACTHDEGTPFHFRISLRGKNFFLVESDGELLDTAGAEGGPYPSLEAAKAAAERFNVRAFHASIAPPSKPADMPPAATDEEIETLTGPQGAGWIDAANPPPAGRIYHLGGDEGDVRFIRLNRSESDGVTFVDAGYADNNSPLTNAETEDSFTLEEWNANWGRSPDVTFTDPAVAPAPQSEIRNPQSEMAPSGPLPPPRSSDVSLALVDVVHNPRTVFEPPSLLALGESLMHDGQDEAVALVKLPGGRFRLVDGERRYRAALAAGMASLRADVYDSLDERQIRLRQLRTFTHKRSLSHAEWSRELTDPVYGDLNDVELAKLVGASDDHVRKHRMLAGCVGELREAVEAGTLALNKALVIQRLYAGGLVEKAAAVLAQCVADEWSEKRTLAEVTAILNPALPGLETVAEGQEAWRAVLLTDAELGLDRDASDVLVAAGIGNLGDLVDFQKRHGEYWPREIRGLTDMSGKANARCGRIDDAFANYMAILNERTNEGVESARLEQERADDAAAGEQDDAGTPGTDEHDQVNTRKADRINEAPIKGTKTDTRNEHHDQAKRDSDAAAGDTRQVREAADPMEPAGPVAGRIGISGQLATDDLGLLVIRKATLTVAIGTQTKLLSLGELRLDLDRDAEAVRKLIVAAAMGEKLAGKKINNPPPARPATKAKPAAKPATKPAKKGGSTKLTAGKKK